jgi:predicted N-acetyltransferase YhbS
VRSVLRMRIRAATMADIPALEKLITASVRALSQNYYTADQIDQALTEIFGVDSQLISDETYFVAEAAGQIAGCGGWSKRHTLFGSDALKAGLSDRLLDPGKEPARVRAFYVHPDWARRGIGKQILHACEDAAARAGFTRIVLVATLPGRPFYSAMGYAVTEETELRMSHHESLQAYLMEKTIS